MSNKQQLQENNELLQQIFDTLGGNPSAAELWNKVNELDSEMNNHTHDSSDIKDAIPVSKGGTGASTVADAITNLGALSANGGTMTGTLYINKTTDASSSADNNSALIIGDRSGEHIAIDGNEIIPKSGAKAGGTLYLGDGEDTVISISGLFRVNSYSHGDSLPSPGIAGRVFFKKVT